MAQGLIYDTTLSDIADAIREKTGKSDLLLPSEMADEILSISGGGGAKNILSGTDNPTSSIGTNGDIYLQYIDTVEGQIEYIESSGTQWIDTLFTPNQDTSIEIKIRPLSGGNSWQDYYGSRVSGTNRNYEFQRDGDTIAIGYGSSQISNLFTAPYGTDITVKMDRNKLYVNGSLENTFTGYTFTCPYALVLFGLRNNNSTPQSFSKNRLYFCKIWDDGTLVRDFYPVKDGSNIICLYDKISGNYFYNQGSGNFTGGNAYDADFITSAYCKVNGAWQALLGTDIDDVNTGGVDGE